MILKFLKQCKELYVRKFLLRFNSQHKPFQGQLLAGEGRIPSLQNTFSQLSQTLKSSIATFDPSPVEGSALVFSTSRGNTSRDYGSMFFSWS